MSPRPGWQRGARWATVAAVLLVAFFLVARWRGHGTPQYVTAAATRGPLQRAVVTTGAVNPVVTVQVGTYVSGVIQSLTCDYNTPVKAGQLCAKIDPRPYQVVVDQDAASLASAQAQLNKDRAALVYAQVNFDRDSRLRKQGIVSQDAVDNDKSVLDQAAAQIHLDEATVEERRATLSASKVNLDYTNIISPVDGVVVSRSVDVGQTVAASFQTPTLFLIAKDLTKMQVDTNVSESDVGAIKDGQKATFTVESYPTKTFEGQVTQVRQAPITVQNVVTYDVVVSVDNPDLLLFPGMTANTRVITEERADVVRVPAQALKFTPHAARGGEAGNDARSADAAASDGGADGATPAAHGSPGGGAKRQHATRVWVLRDGQPTPVKVTAGLSDGSLVEIASGDLHEGDRVIVKEISDEAKSSRAAAAPGGGLRGPRF
ncbi:MAG TPA: efflux RND transporter periplasmic adaptor subunit [Candidatus Binatia bacterium]|jgi:HlyD family secretion protein